MAQRRIVSLVGGLMPKAAAITLGLAGLFGSMATAYGQAPATPVPAAPPAATTPAQPAKDKPATAAQPADADSAKAAAPASSTATRVAILPFGLGNDGDTVGIEISHKAFLDAIPKLKKEGVEVVIVRFNSGGGLAAEVPKFHTTFMKDFKKEFRTVGWIESAISAAAMSCHALEEIYFMPEGNYGACTAWHGDLVAAEGRNLEGYLYMMEEVSRATHRDPKIMRAMQIMEPLSASTDADGNVTWTQDLKGQNIVNPEKRILTFNSSDAAKYKFSKGTAATKEDLVKLMGLGEVDWVGKDVEKAMVKYHQDTNKAAVNLGELWVKYQAAVAAAQGSQERTQRAAEVGKARRLLRQIKQIVDLNPNFKFMYPFNDDFFDEQEQMLKDLLR